MTVIEKIQQWFETVIFASSTSYMPHGNCYLWQTPLVQLHVVSDALIAIAYFSIPIMLVYFAYQRRSHLPFSLFLMFGAFITLCGVGHLLEIWTLWHPAYWLTGVEAAMTALVSCYTAVALYTLLPQFLALKTPDELEAVNQQLREEAIHRQVIADELITLNQNLEELVAARTQELEQRNEALKQAQAQLVQSEKMAALGQMVGGIAHEVNNPLSFIHGNLTHTEGYADDLFTAIARYEAEYPTPAASLADDLEALDLPYIREDFPKVIGSMRSGADRIKQVMTALRSFSRLDESGAKQADIHEGLNSSIEILMNRIAAMPRTIAIEKSYDAQVTPFQCFPGPLNQVFFNVLSNGLDAIEQRLATGETFTPLLRIETRLKTVDSASKPGTQEASLVQIQILDNGKAIAPSEQEHVFDPFFTTKDVGQGTGLGLSQAYQTVVTQHGGQLRFEERQPDLKALIIELPIANEAIAPSQEGQEPLLTS